ncbi:hypothetical protein P691DRAFT_777087, partial [Macrolepiota fuliginosa MF-IS2]
MSGPPTVDQPLTHKRMAKMASNQSANLNHLLNFTLPPRQTRSLQSIPRRSRQTGTIQGVWNKERFVNAQYRFVMNPSGDYTVHFADPDMHWQDILQVIIPRSSALVATGEQSSFAQDDSQTICPICLSPPTAPRMTKCGHIFCFPCILHYLGTSDNKWARCPICFDSVNERQLKCVKWFDGFVDSTDDSNSSVPGASSSSSTIDAALEDAPKPGSFLRMRLVQRPQITTLALPRSHTWPSDLLPPHQAPFHFLPDVYNFAKFMLATPAYLTLDLTKDLDELASERRILAGMKDELGVSFVDGAEVKIRQQIDKATALNTPILKDQIDKALKDQHDLEERSSFHERRRTDEELSHHRTQEEVPTDFLAVRSRGTSASISTIHTQSRQAPASQEPPPNPTATHSRHHRHRRNINPPPPSTQTYYYYQAASGLPIYLHPLDIRILLSHFGSYSSFPDNITVRVEASSESTIDDYLRKRCKYLAHMPEGADVVFIEADLRGVVGAEGLKNFEGSLKLRTAKRREKGRKDDKAKARAEEREREREKVWTSSASYSVPQLNSVDVRDTQLMEDFSALVMPHSQEPGASPSTPPSAPQQQNAVGAWGARSFASALHLPPTHPPSRGQQRVDNVEDEWDLDVAWHELEQRAGGKKKKGAKLVVLGG